jgi:hypothetical protein
VICTIVVGFIVTQSADKVKCCLPCSEYLSDTNTSTYAVPDTYGGATTGRLLPPQQQQQPQPPQQPSFKPFLPGGASRASGGSPPPLPPPPHPRDIYSSQSVDIGLQGCSGNSCYAVPDDDPESLWPLDAVGGQIPAVVEFHRDNLLFIERLGEGPHGEVMSLQNWRGACSPFVGSDGTCRAFARMYEWGDNY